MISEELFAQCLKAWALVPADLDPVRMPSTSLLKRTMGETVGFRAALEIAYQAGLRDAVDKTVNALEDATLLNSLLPELFPAPPKLKEQSGGGANV